MKRVPEPELMDDAAQAAAYAIADFAEVNQGFVDRFCATFPDFVGGTVVDLGCGPGDIVVRMAQALPDAIFTAVDGAEAMLDHARKVVHDARLEGRIVVQRAVLPGLEGTYDAIVSNSLLHHLHDPLVLWAQVREIAAPGAHILVMDLTRPDSLEEAQAIVERYAASEREILKQDFFASLCAAFTVAEVQVQLARAGLPLNVEMVSDRHLVVCGRIPQNS